MSRSRSLSQRAAVTILSAVVVSSALWRGGVAWPVQAGAGLAGAAALWLAARPRHRTSEPTTRTPKALPWLVAGLFFSMLLVGLQLLPLPPGILSALSPASADLQRDALGPLGLYPAWRPLSLAPGSTALELARIASWVLLSATAALLASSRAQADQLLAAIAVSGAVVAGLGFGAALAGVGRLTESGVVFVNPNHLASFMLLTCWIALGFGLRERGPKRVAWFVAFVATATQVFLSLSRSGIAAFFVGAGVSAVLAVRSGHAARAFQQVHRAPPVRLGRLVAGPLVVFAAIAVSAWLALDRVVAEFRTIANVDADVKLSLWPLAWQVIRDFPFFGVGRGSFPTVFPAYKVEVAQVTFTHLESTWLQLPTELGVPAGLALLGLMAWSWLVAARDPEVTRPMLGALAGVAAVAAHDVFDFSLELNGIAIPFLMILAMGARGGPVIRVPRWALRATALLGTTIMLAGFSLHLLHRVEVQAAVVASSSTADEAMVATALALTWHPADWLPPAVVGTKLVDEGRCREGLEWLMRAMTRSPTAPQPHRAAARCLAASGQDAFAKREYRLAFEYGDAGALKEALGAFPEPGALLQVAPDSPEGLMTAGSLLQAHPQDAAEAYRRAWEAFRLPAALAGWARSELSGDDPEKALELAQALQRAAPADPNGYIIASAVFAKLGQTEKAVRALEQGISIVPRRSELLFALGYRLLAAQQYSRAKQVLESIIAREGREVAAKQIAIAQTLEGQGRYLEALKMARASSDSLPGDTDPLHTIARIAEKAQFYDIAIDAIERAAVLPGRAARDYDGELNRLRIAKNAQGLRWLGSPGGSRQP